MTPEFVDPMRNVRPILWVLLVGGTLASLAGNITHAVMNAPAGTFPLGPVIAAVLAPAFLLGLMHLMGVWARDSLGAGAMQVFLLAAVAAIGLVAFRLSFSSVRDLAKSYGYGQVDAAMFPFMLDGVIVICTVSLVAASRLTDRARSAHPLPTEQLPAQEPITTAAVRTPASVPMPTPAEPTQVVHIEQLTAPGAQRITAADEVITTPIPAQYPAATTEQLGEQQAVTCDNAPVDHLDEPAVQHDARVIPLVSRPAEQKVVTGDRTAADEQLPSARQVRTTPVSTQELPTGEAADDQSATAQEIDPERDAQVLIERGSRLDEEKLTDLIARIAAGESYSSISETTGVSRNTIRKIAGQVPTEPEPVPVA